MPGDRQDAHDVKAVCLGEGSIDFTFGTTTTTIVCDIGRTTLLTIPVTVPDTGSGSGSAVPVVVTPRVTGDGPAILGYLPGRYRVHAACVGFGTATLIVGRATTEGIPARSRSVEVTCGQATPLDYDLTAGCPPS